MRLADAEATNIYRNNAFFVTQSYGIPLQRVTESDFSMANLSAVFIGHSFEYSSWSKVYTDVQAEPIPNERDERDERRRFRLREGIQYYKNWFINPARDARLDLRAGDFEPLLHSGAALGPQRCGRDD